MSTEHHRIELRVTGRVQGVYYRANTAETARRLGLTGWVCNRDDGSVEAVAEGPRAALDQLVAWCHQGPPAARVDSVEVRNGAATGEHADFSVRY